VKDKAFGKARILGHDRWGMSSSWRCTTASAELEAGLDRLLGSSTSAEIPRRPVVAADAARTRSAVPDRRIARLKLAHDWRAASRSTQIRQATKKTTTRVDSRVPQPTSLGNHHCTISRPKFFRPESGLQNEITVDARISSCSSALQRATPPQESVQEFRVVNNSFGSNMPAMGGIVNIVTKGGHQLHGSIYDYLQNNKAHSRCACNPRLPYA